MENSEVDLDSLKFLRIEIKKSNDLIIDSKISSILYKYY